FHMLRDDLFVADAVLDRADGARIIEGASSLRNRIASVNGFCGDNAVIAARNFTRVARGIEIRGEVSSTGNAKAVCTDRIDVIFPDIVSPDFDFALAREMRGEETADSATANDADLQQTDLQFTDLRSEVRGQIAEVSNLQSDLSPLTLLLFWTRFTAIEKFPLH